MTKLMNTAGAAGILMAALVANGSARATDTVPEGQAVTMQLGPDTSAISYWTRSADGWHVVTTVDTVMSRDSDAERHVIVRSSAVLLPGQEHDITVPVAIG